MTLLTGIRVSAQQNGRVAVFAYVCVIQKFSRAFLLVASHHMAPSPCFGAPGPTLSRDSPAATEVEADNAALSALTAFNSPSPFCAALAHAYAMLAAAALRLRFRRSRRHRNRCRRHCHLPFCFDSDLWVRRLPAPPPPPPPLLCPATESTVDFMPRRGKLKYFKLPRPDLNARF